MGTGSKSWPCFEEDQYNVTKTSITYFKNVSTMLMLYVAKQKRCQVLPILQLLFLTLLSRPTIPSNLSLLLSTVPPCSSHQLRMHTRSYQHVV